MVIRKISSTDTFCLIPFTLGDIFGLLIECTNQSAVRGVLYELYELIM